MRFNLQHRDRLFPGVPIVFTGVERHAAADIALPDDATGVWLSPGWRTTLEAALRLQPGTERAVVVTGASGIDRVWAAAARTQLESIRSPIPIEYLVGPPLESLLERVATLPPQTVLLLGPFSRDATARDFRTLEIINRLAGTASVPAYSVLESTIGGGVVGGHVVSFEAQGARTGELAIRVLRGEAPAAGDIDTNVYRFDARQLRRWRLDTRRLPAGSVVLYDEPSVWRQYGGYIAGGLALMALQSVLIAALLAQRAQRRRAEQALADRLRFETLLAELSAMFASRAGGEVDRHIEDACDASSRIWTWIGRPSASCRRTATRCGSRTPGPDRASRRFPTSWTAACCRGSSRELARVRPSRWRGRRICPPRRSSI